MKYTILSTAVAALLVSASLAMADENPIFDSGKLLATAGVSSIEGAGGGGLTPWALITGYGTRDGIGANVHETYVGLGDYSLNSAGVAVGLYDRVELSYARQTFKGTQGGLNGLGIGQDVYGIKVKLIGDAVYGQDTWVPQVAVGMLYKSNDNITGLGAPLKPTNLGASKNDGADFYVAATKLYLDESLLANVTLRATKANQFGLLGFGSATSDNYKLEPEISLAYLFTRQFAVGAEYRAKPNNLNATLGKEDAAYDLFAAYFLNRNVSLTLAYVDLGTIAPAAVPSSQRGTYASVQFGF